MSCQKRGFSSSWVMFDCGSALMIPPPSKLALKLPSLQVRDTVVPKQRTRFRINAVKEKITQPVKFHGRFCSLVGGLRFHFRVRRTRLNYNVVKTTKDAPILYIYNKRWVSRVIHDKLLENIENRPVTHLVTLPWLPNDFFSLQYIVASMLCTLWKAHINNGQTVEKKVRKRDRETWKKERKRSRYIVCV